MQSIEATRLCQFKIHIMKTALIGSYPPRECGIGTFSQNLFSAMNHSSGLSDKGIVVAMDDQEETYDYPSEVQFRIRQEQQGDYIEAAKFINVSGADVCVL